MIALLVNLTERLGILVMVSYLLSRSTLFRRLLWGKLTRKENVIIIIIFGLFGIVGTYWGIPIYGAIANSRVIGPAIAGIIGGPVIGGFAGLIAGIHRVSLGGFTALACGVSTTLEGVLAGLLAQRHHEKRFSWRFGLMTGIFLEVVQMLIIITIARPFNAAFSLVKFIGVPMIFVNGAGIAIFLLILDNAFKEEERIGSFYAQKVLAIANETLPLLRNGLDLQHAQELAKIVYKEIGAKAIALTDKQNILAHVGWGEDHHRPGDLVHTQATKDALASGKVTLVNNKKELGCDHPDCQLYRAVILPLKVKEQVVGALKIYYSYKDKVNDVIISFAEGLAQLISTQLELAAWQKQAELLAKAELKSLQAQIHPHFLFNALNTISALCRLNPLEAKDITLMLADFLRRSLKEWEPLISLKDELDTIDLYLNLEKARFRDKLEVCINIEPNLYDTPIPPFSLQTLVDNSIRHGLLPQKGGRVEINGYHRENKVVIEVIDDGVGFNKGEKGLGIGLTNVTERLNTLFGKEAKLELNSLDGKTLARLTLPEQY